MTWCDEHPLALFLIVSAVLVVATTATVLLTGGPTTWDGCHAT